MFAGRNKFRPPGKLSTALAAYAIGLCGQACTSRSQDRSVECLGQLTRSVKREVWQACMAQQHQQALNTLSRALEQGPLHVSVHAGSRAVQTVSVWLSDHLSAESKPD